MKRDELEMKALLAESGEAQLTAAEAEQTAAWRRDAARVATLAWEALSIPPPSADAVEAVRLAAVRQRSHARHRLIFWRLAAAASLAVLTWSGWGDLQSRRTEQRLARLEAVLVLLESELPAEDGETTSSVLAQRLLQMQDGDATPEG